MPRVEPLIADEGKRDPSLEGTRSGPSEGSDAILTSLAFLS